MASTRIDLLMVDRGLAPSRERARALLIAGLVRANGRAVTKAGTLVDESSDVELTSPDHPYVGRGGLKLAHALDTFAVPVEGPRGAGHRGATGGFTDVLLRRGARRVVALDVGHGQLDWSIRSDPRVVVIEHFNARNLTPADLPGPVDLVVIDVSFISLRHILQCCRRCCARAPTSSRSSSRSSKPDARMHPRASSAIRTCMHVSCVTWWPSALR
jgi:23S rRNA (cytidine1920-2'-O)/16S rRNA (cytidine1409-2'-O)-methyltransferase